MFVDLTTLRLNTVFGRPEQNTKNFVFFLAAGTLLGYYANKHKTHQERRVMTHKKIGHVECGRTRQVVLGCRGVGCYCGNDMGLQRRAGNLNPSRQRNKATTRPLPAVRKLRMTRPRQRQTHQTHEEKTR